MLKKSLRSKVVVMANNCLCCVNNVIISALGFRFILFIKLYVLDIVNSPQVLDLTLKTNSCSKPKLIILVLLSLQRTPVDYDLSQRRWQESGPSVRDHSSSVKWRWGATPPCWTTAAPPCPLCLERRPASWAWRDSTASFFISSLLSCSHCCSSSRPDGGGTNALSLGGCFSPEASSGGFSPTSCSGHFCTGWCMYTEMIYHKTPETVRIKGSFVL